AARRERRRLPNRSHSPAHMSRPYTTHAGGLARIARRASTARIATGIIAASSVVLLLGSSPSLDSLRFSLVWQQFCPPAPSNLEPAHPHNVCRPPPVHPCPG